MRLGMTTVAFLLFGLLSVARADYMDYHFEVHCESEKNRAEIVPYAVYNSDIYSTASQECEFSNGRTIRAKMGLGPVYPYGMGGADPDKWLSVWVDKAQVLSQTRLGCGGEGPCSLRVIVTAKGLNVCRRELPDPLVQQKSPKPPKERCEFTPNNKLSRTRDSLEFPLPNERRRPAAGSLATLYSKDTQFCSQFPLLDDPRGRSSTGDNIWPHIGLPNDAESIEPDKSSFYRYGDRYRHYNFDVNNDGTNEAVVGLHARFHASDGDTYFVYADGKVPSLEDEEEDEEGSSPRSELDYAKTAKGIIPHDWDLGDGAYRIKNVDAPWWDASDTPIFRFSYWYLWPFRYKQTTYFLTWSQEAAKQHWYTILRPDINNHVTEMCVFQVVKERY